MLVCSSAVGAPYEANLHPNSQCMSPAAAKQATADHLTVCKPMASHGTALNTHEPPLWHMGPTGPKLAVRRLCGAGTESEAPRQVRRKTMRSHEVCCFSMMMTNVPDALVAIVELHMDLSMSSRAPAGLPSVHHRGQSGLNLPLQAKVPRRC